MTAAARESLIEVTDAAFGYDGRAVVRVEGLELARGNCVGIFGQNGSGKTTLVHGLLGLLPPIEGRVDRPGGRRLRSGYLSQYRRIDFGWPMTGWDAACLAVSARKRFGLMHADAKESVRESMRAMGVADLGVRSFAALSGGQQQRLLLAGALADRPDVLVLDEPTDGLDLASRARLLATLGELRSKGLCVVMISHDLDDLLGVCDDVAWLHAAAEPSGPSRVERLTPQQLGHRLVGGGGV